MPALNNSSIGNSSTDNNLNSLSQEDLRQQSIPSDSDRHFQLYEEKLFTRKRRVKTGEVRISKQIVHSQTAAAVPITKEKIVIEIESIYGTDTRLDIGEARVAEDGSMRMDIYEEQATVCREVIPYQSVSVRKEVVSDIVTAEEILRREELTVETEGAPRVEERGTER